MDNVIDYYFWTSSDWAYFGNPRLKEIARKYGLAINYFPVDLATVYARTGGIKLALRSQERKDYRLEEMRRFSRDLSMPIVMQPRFPIVSTEMSSRVIIAAQAQGLPVHDLVHAVMAARWVHDEDIESRQVLTDVLRGLGLNASSIWDGAEQKEIADRYVRYTEEATGRGVFGSPFYFFRGEPFWGQDRLEHLRRAIAGGS